MRLQHRVPLALKQSANGGTQSVLIFDDEYSDARLYCRFRQGIAAVELGAHRSGGQSDRRKGMYGAKVPRPVETQILVGTRVGPREGVTAKSGLFPPKALTFVTWATILVRREPKTTR
jgi:hypothetical protein